MDSQPAASTTPWEYRAFVSHFLAKIQNDPTVAPKDRMRLCGIAWQKLDPSMKAPKKPKSSIAKASKIKDAASPVADDEDDDSSAHHTSSAAVGKAARDRYKSILLRQPDTVESLNIHPRARNVFQVRKTKTNQRVLNAKVAEFKRLVKEGKVKDHMDTFFHALYLIPEIQEQELQKVRSKKLPEITPEQAKTLLP